MINEEQKFRILRMREELGYTYNAIAEKMGVPYYVVAWHCQINGVERKGKTSPSTTGRNYHRNGRPVRAFTPEEDRIISEMDRSGKGYQAIGKAIGRNKNSIHGRLASLARMEERKFQNA